MFNKLLLPAPPTGVSIIFSAVFVHHSLSLIPTILSQSNLRSGGLLFLRISNRLLCKDGSGG